MVMVFISHSARGDETADRVCEELRMRLGALGWDVKVDTDALSEGVEWRDQIYGWLADCDAAVILLNQAALNSSWVRREAHLLMWRRALGSRPSILPVRLPDVTTSEIRRSEISDVATLQLVKAHRDDPGCTRLADRIAALLPDLRMPGRDEPDSSTMYMWSNKVMSCLAQVDEAQLRRAAGLLAGGGGSHFTGPREGRRFVAHQLLGKRAGESLYQAMSAIEFDVPRLADLVQLVSPTWIDSAAARQLVPFGAVFDEESGRTALVPRRVVAALNSRRPDTAQQYVDRASCCGEGYWVQTVSLVAGESQKAEFDRDCAVAIRRLLHLDENESTEGVAPYAHDKLFLVLDPNSVPLDDVEVLVAELTLKHGWLNVIVLTGADGPGCATFPQLSPAMQPVDEEKARRAIRAMADLVARRASA